MTGTKKSAHTEEEMRTLQRMENHLQTPRHDVSAQYETHISGINWRGKCPLTTSQSKFTIMVHVELMREMLSDNVQNLREGN